MIICPYMGNLYFPEFTVHCEEIKSKGFDTILFCITETDLLYYLPNFKDMREYAESEGFKTIANPWGVGGLFAGEAINRTHGYPAFEKWLDEVMNVGFTNVLLDEPKADLNIIKELIARYPLVFHLCFDDVGFEKSPDVHIADDLFQTVGLSAYFWTNDISKIAGRCSRWFQRLVTLRPGNNFVFLQGFDLPEGDEWIIQEVKTIAQSYGITNFGFWAFRSFAGCKAKMAINGEKIWKELAF